ncbi:hypothetical protein SAMN05421837_113213 [Amycolatopsis pretoriensis]|uniref:Uncharacterized protein n=1 Tax=Amycolatopsis pretoriensis TaxID=218821 RepID=A0A1H5RG79_9PSEU|nr:hypothetical protein SAMN05421837_113213 [Amycolatopsis pretoriensis]
MSLIRRLVNRAREGGGTGDRVRLGQVAESNPAPAAIC